MSATVTDLQEWKARRARLISEQLGLTPQEAAIFVQCDSTVVRSKAFLDYGFDTDGCVKNIAIYLNGLLCIIRSLDTNEVNIQYGDMVQHIDEAAVLEVTVNGQLIYLAILGRVIINAHCLKLQDYLELLMPPN